jgi:hypothetical protein
MGGVFINYRVVDNPLGAAGIHEGLATRFGKTNVFRDCVSLEAGEEYPAAIRAALAESDVLVSIIGPQWLTLRAPDGTRLLDRDYDWVRRELAMAHEQGIAVLPVLLRDTPVHAFHPTADDLPPDIRWLATIQAFAFSQLTFGADLDRLATRLTALAPGLPRNGSTQAVPKSYPLMPRASTELVTALEAVPCISNEDTRALLVSQLRPTISGAIRHYSQRRAHVMSIVQTCLNYEDGMAELVAAIANFERADSLPFQNLVDILRQVFPETTIQN